MKAGAAFGRHSHRDMHRTRNNLPETTRAKVQADELEDKDTADVFTEISRGVDTWLWFVEALLQADR